MQLSLTFTLGFLAAITPALASRTVVSVLEDLSKANSDVRDNFKAVGKNTIPEASQGENNYFENILLVKKKFIDEFPSHGIDEVDGGVKVCDSFIEFATTGGDLMNTLIEKHALFKAAKYAKYIFELLEKDENLTSIIGYNVIGVSPPSCDNQLNDAREKLRVAYDAAYSKYKS